MSATSKSTNELSSARVAYLTAERAGIVAGVAGRTIRSNVKPDAWYTSVKGDKEFPLYTAETVEAFRAERNGGGE